MITGADRESTRVFHLLDAETPFVFRGATFVRRRVCEIVRNCLEQSNSTRSNILYVPFERDVSNDVCGESDDSVVKKWELILKNYTNI